MKLTKIVYCFSFFEIEKNEKIKKILENMNHEKTLENSTLKYIDFIRFKKTDLTILPQSGTKILLKIGNLKNGQFKTVDCKIDDEKNIIIVYVDFRDIGVLSPEYLEKCLNTINTWETEY